MNPLLPILLFFAAAPAFGCSCSDSIDARIDMASSAGVGIVASSVTSENETIVTVAETDDQKHHTFVFRPADASSPCPPPLAPRAGQYAIFFASPKGESVSGVCYGAFEVSKHLDGSLLLSLKKLIEERKTSGLLVGDAIDALIHLQTERDLLQPPPGWTQDHSDKTNPDPD